MGLDLMLYARNKETREDIELAYARKVWNIWYFFRDFSKDESEDGTELTITKANWMIFVLTLKTVKSLLISASEVYDKESDYWSREEVRAIIAFEKWYDCIFTMSPTLGYDWDCRALLKWLEASETVLSYADNDSYELVLSASY